jgi:hypothetical protein
MSAGKRSIATTEYRRPERQKAASAAFFCCLDLSRRYGLAFGDGCRKSEHPDLRLLAKMWRPTG